MLMRCKTIIDSLTFQSMILLRTLRKWLKKVVDHCVLCLVTIHTRLWTATDSTKNRMLLALKEVKTNRIYYWSLMQTVKSLPEGKG